jgi:CRP/FNR family transcriptional regulator, cyclic AMP receptor protein
MSTNASRIANRTGRLKRRTTPLRGISLAAKPAPPGRNGGSNGATADPAQNALQKTLATFDAEDFLAKAGLGRAIVARPKGEAVFSQGDPADSVFYIQKGKVKISIVSKSGKEATIALLGAGEFLGEDCIATTHRFRLASATSLTDCILLKIDKNEMVRVLHQQHGLSDVFVTYLLARNARIQDDLIDQLFNSSEKRLARILLLLAQFGKEGKPEIVIPKMSQETLAEMIGTTRSRVSFFMNRFRKMGFIEYNGEMRIHSSLLNVILHD